MSFRLTNLYLLRLTSLFTALALFMTVPMLAHAASASTINLGGLWDSLRPFISAAVEGVIAAVIGWIGLRVHKWTGINMEARHREALHSAATTGANLAYSRLGGLAGGITADVRSAAIAEAYSWIVRSVPDALVYLGVTPEKTRDIAEAKLNALIGSKAARPALPQMHDISAIRGLQEKLAELSASTPR